MYINRNDIKKKYKGWEYDFYFKGIKYRAINNEDFLGLNECFIIPYKNNKIHIKNSVKTFRAIGVSKDVLIKCVKLFIAEQSIVVKEKKEDFVIHDEWEW